MTPLLSTPWVDANGNTLSVRSLPGLRPEVIQTLKSAYPGIINPSLEALLANSCGLADTELGSIDFTGCCFPEEPCAVFQPCLTLAIDDAGRRWIAEVRDRGLPGPVWCVFAHPQVAVRISDDLPAFLATLHGHAQRGQTLDWLQELTAAAQAVWSRRRALALRPYNIDVADEEIREWLSSLPSDAFVYDLRRESSVRGWPYGVAGPSGRLYRCGRLPVFAVAASPLEGWRAGRPDTTLPIQPIAAVGLALQAPAVLRRRRATIWRSAIAAIGLCAVAAPAMADEWVQTLPNLWVSATALSLTLVTAVGRPKK
jgi:hypothetical protein